MFHTDFSFLNYGAVDKQAFSPGVGLIRVVAQSKAALFAVRVHLPYYETLKRHEKFNHNVSICNYL